MKCPIDGQPLLTRPYEGSIHVDACKACGGTWLDEGELERIQERPEINYIEELAEIPEAGLEAYRAARASGAPSRECPRCGRSMERREHGYCSQVMVDTCPTCHGTWLDAGELAALEVFFERSRLETAGLRRTFLHALRWLER